MEKDNVGFINNIVPENFVMTFQHRNKVVGEIIIKEKTGMEFKGTLGKSAVIFMNFIKPHIEKWLEEKLKSIHNLS